VVILCACGPPVDAGPDSGTGTSSSESANATTTAPSPTTDSTSSTGSTVDAGSTELDATTESTPIPVEYEGVLYQPDFFSESLHFRPCNGPPGGWCVTGDAVDGWRCEGVFMHVRGNLIPNPHAGALDANCGEQLLEVEELVAAHESTPSDCDQGPLDCGVGCNAWDQDCAEGEKCVPHGPPGTRYAGTRCVDVASSPDAPGEACQPVAWPDADTCEVGSVCTNIDPRSEEGTCTAQCSGSENDPVCDGGDVCHVDNGGSVSLCFTPCDPLASTCAAGLECITTSGGAYSVCVRAADLYLYDAL
jgi:hypothetical protein